MAHRYKGSFKKTLFSLIVIGILAGLGTWQMERRAWKTQLVRNMDERQRQPTLNQIPQGTNYEAIQFRRVALTGLIDDSKILFLGPRTQNGKAGYYMYVPMTLQDRRVILLNRGFIENAYRSQVRPTMPHVEAVSGMLKIPSAPGLFTPHNTDSGNEYYWLDLSLIASRLGTPTLMAMTLELDSSATNQFATGGAQMEAVENKHLQYALTWYGLALVAFIYLIITSFRRTGMIEAGFRMQNPDLAQGMPFGRNGTTKGQKPKLDDKSLWS